MITKVNVSGFKSLIDFDLDLSRGLNILVGPNGAGKTNIVLFFEFLSNIAFEELHHAVTKTGGAGSIFKKIGEKDYANQIEATIWGSKKIEEMKYLNYSYSFVIEIAFQKDLIFFKKQSMRCYFSNTYTTQSKSSDQKYELDILQITDESTLKSNFEIVSINLNKFRPRYGVSRLRKKSFIKEFNRILCNEVSATTSLLRALFIFGEPVFSISEDFTAGETFNIVPLKVKQTEDSTTPPGIQKDGSGLAATLYSMKKSKSQLISRGFYFSPFQYEEIYNENTLHKIIGFLKLANPSILQLDVDNDPFNNQLWVRITVECENDKSILPLSSMSDGTIKWLSIITAILTSKDILSLEEPENYLHPWMQSEIVKIMRQSSENKSFESAIILTTHSETLLNFARPEEVIVISMIHGKTKASRIHNIELLNEEINKTGFGLGHYYFLNAFDNE